MFAVGSSLVLLGDLIPHRSVILRCPGQVLFGLFHGLAVLPVLLVLLVPGHKSTKTVVPTSRKVRIEVKPWNVDDNKDSLA